MRACDGTHGLIDFLLVRQSFQQLSGRSPVCPLLGDNPQSVRNCFICGSRQTDSRNLHEVGEAVTRFVEEPRLQDPDRALWIRRGIGPRS